MSTFFNVYREGELVRSDLVLSVRMYSPMSDADRIAHAEMLAAEAGEGSWVSVFDGLRLVADHIGAPTLTKVAEDFNAAAAILTDANAPVHVLADLLDEADYLAEADPETIGAPDVVSRYIDTTRASRRQTVCLWLRRSGRTQASPKVRDALELIGGQGS